MDFIYKDGVYYRVVNDLLQNVEIWHSSMGCTYRVTFGLLPLCAGITNLHQGCLYELANFCISDCTSYNSGWYYEKGNAEAKRLCVESITSYWQTYLSPLFASADCCRTAFPALRAVFRKFEDTRLIQLKRAGISGVTSSFEMQCYLDRSLLYMALKNHDYSYASKALGEILQAEKSGYMNNVARYISEERLQKHARTICDLQALAKDVEGEKAEQIEGILVLNERKSKELLDSL